VKRTADVIDVVSVVRFADYLLRLRPDPSAEALGYFQAVRCADADFSPDSFGLKLAGKIGLFVFIEHVMILANLPETLLVPLS